MWKILMVGIGGFLGSICRYTVGRLVNETFKSAWFPCGTLTVNVAGCFLIGLLAGIFENRQVLTPEIRLLIFAGFLGGFTTFSAFGLEIFTLLKNGRVAASFANLALHGIMGLGAVWGGYALGKSVT